MSQRHIFIFDRYPRFERVPCLPTPYFPPLPPASSGLTTPELRSCFAHDHRGRIVCAVSAGQSVGCATVMPRRSERRAWLWWTWLTARFALIECVMAAYAERRPSKCAWWDLMWPWPARSARFTERRWRLAASGLRSRASDDRAPSLPGSRLVRVIPGDGPGDDRLESAQVDFFTADLVIHRISE